MTSSPELAVVRWASQHVSAKMRCAMCHDYAGAPWGPFTNVDDDKRAPLVEALRGWRLLTDSEHVAAYHNRFAPPLYEKDAPVARRCYGACYGYYQSATLPHYPLAIRERFVTVISPCAPKGMSILAALAPRMPDVQFLAVATAWTNPAVQHILKRFSNVTVEAGTTRVDDFYARTKVLSPSRYSAETRRGGAAAATGIVREDRPRRRRGGDVDSPRRHVAAAARLEARSRSTPAPQVLIVPSIWPEAFGLVAMEASARGIPVISTDHGGLAEANPVERLRLRTRYFYDHAGFRMLSDVHLDDMVERPRPDPPEDVAGARADADLRAKLVSKHLWQCLLRVAPAGVADPFAAMISKLVGDDAYYAAAARDARASALAFIARHEGRFGMILREELGKVT